MGVKTTRVVKYIRKGDTGDKGEQGATLRGPQAWADCAIGYAFKAGGPGETWVDVVLYNSNYYICKTSHTKTANNYPGSTAAENQGLWQLGDKIALVATQVLLAENAVIAGWIFRNGRLESADGLTYLDGQTGNSRLKGVLQLASSTSGNFEDTNIYYLPASTTEKYIYLQADVKHIGKVIRMFNSGTAGTHKKYRIHCTNFGADVDGDISWEDLGGYSALLGPQEWAEFTCIKTKETATEIDAAWELSGRFSAAEFLNDDAMGRFPLVLAMGRFNGASSVSNCTIYGSVWNKKDSGNFSRNLKNNPFYITRVGEGIYEIYALSSVIPYGSLMMVNGYGHSGSHTDSYALLATVTNQYVSGSYTYFRVEVHDDTSNNDGDFTFIIFGPLWGYNLS